MQRRIAPAALALALAVSSCSDSNPLRPTDDGGPLVQSPSFALVDAANDGAVPGFYFLPPLASNPVTEGAFDPNMEPSMEVCELSGNPLSGAVTCGAIVKTFDAGSASVSGSGYQFNWNTKKVGEMDSNLFYRIRILLEGAELGYLDINPQEPAPGTPGDDYPGLYAFRMGEKLPVKFFLSTAARCATAEGYVIQCTASAVFDQAGGVLSLEPTETNPDWPTLSVVLPAGALPGYDQITVTIERIDPDLFAAANFGEECIPAFDAPQFSDCLRVTTDPVLEAPLEVLARIEMCIDPYALGLPVAQLERLQIIRYAGNGVTQGLIAADATTCPAPPSPSPSVIGLLPVPRDEGFMRTAAIGVNTVARFFAPEDLAAIGGIRLAGSTSNFSRFRWALPGAMLITEGDGVVLQAADDKDIPATIKVVDAAGDPVKGATVHFGTGANPGSVTTGSDGLATTTWTVPSGAGNQTLTAEAFGLRDGTIPNNETLIEFDTVTVTFTATVIGPPATVTQSPTTTLTGTAGGPASESLVITVTDDANQPVSGAPVVWTASGSGSVTGSSETDGNGSASATWTLSETAGSNTATAEVGGITSTFTAEGAAGDPTTVAASTAQDATVGSAQELTVTVSDQYGNLVPNTEVTWTTTGGTVTSPSTTDVNGQATATWTLSETAGDYGVTATTTVGGIEATFSATALPGDAHHVVVSGDEQTATVGTDVELSLIVLDEYENVRAGDEVEWDATDGAVSGSPTTTDSEGATSVTWTLGTGAGSQTVTASVGGLSHAFTATGTPDVAASLAVTPATAQSAYVGATIPLTATLTDQYANPRVGDLVTWTVTAGGGSASGASAIDALGLAAASWTLGSYPGSNTLVVNAGGLEHTFQATGVCVDGYGTANVNGSMDGAEWACAESTDFTANISGGSTDGFVHWMNDGTNLYLAVRIRQAALEKINDVRFDFDNGNGIHDENDDAIGLVAATQTFFDEFLTKKCANSGQSGCGSADGGSPDGAGRVTNDGTWTTYELSHPLNTGSTRDFSLGTGDPVGFFLTLNIGNGAQGNTQFPGFRVFNPITIKGF